MQNIKYHLLNITSIAIFSYATATTANQVIKYNLSPVQNHVVKKRNNVRTKKVMKTFESYDNILKSGFFKIAEPEVESNDVQVSKVVSSIDNLTLMGTITGPRSIARAMIKKRGEKEAAVFKLWTDVYGSKLIRIYSTRVYLESNGEKVALELFAKKVVHGSRKASNVSSGSSLKKNISRSEIKQKVLNNIDNAMRGLVAGPYRVNGKIVGFRLKKVKPYNILYKFGARSGDIIKRINGHAVNSTQKLYKLWETMKSESKIKIDLERRNKIITFDLNITD